MTNNNIINNKILILDFGSQYTQLIARRLREMKVYAEIFPYGYSLEKIKNFAPKGIILSGGPSSVGEKDSPYRSVTELAEIAPILGLCYGMQLISQDLGGKVSPSHHREYGLTYIDWTKKDFSTLERQVVWMSHGDTVEQMPSGFQELARTQTGALAGMISTDGKYKHPIMALQFHPEVSHTQNGDHIIKKFATDLCNITPDWDTAHILSDIQNKVLKLVPGNENILCALSGGVDSTVVGVLLTKILGPERVKCVFINNGLLRKNEFQEVLGIYKELNLNVSGLDCEKDFLNALAGVTDPEKKRKIIGNKFIEVFDHFVKDNADVKWLAQGTLYPDVIESVSPRGASVTIKTHHNVGGLPANMKLKLVEPVRELFKDEVRLIGRELGIPERILERHPFPGPGLAVRCLGEITKESLDILRDCDAIFIDELKTQGLYQQIWQAFCVLLPVQTVGVQGDNRTYEKSIALRAVTSKDGMTADWYYFSHDFLRKTSSRITNEVRKINRVVMDITSKPPGTIEWE